VSSALGCLGVLFFAETLRYLQRSPALLILNGRAIGLLILPAALLVTGIKFRDLLLTSTVRLGHLHLAFATLLPLLLASIEAFRYFSRAGARSGHPLMSGSAALSVTWTAYAALLLGLGIARRIAALRFAALGLFAITLVKVAFYDLAALDQIYRILSFIVLGLVLMAGAWLYHRFERRLFPRN
jgi:uncharacterized membrane protein